MIKNLFFLLSFSGGVLLFACSCAKAPPNPPRDRIQKVLQMFDALDRRDYKTALEKIAQLRNEDKTNVFLPELESVERENMMLDLATRELMKGNRTVSEKIIADSSLSMENGSLSEAKNRIRSLTELERLASKIQNPASAKDLDESTEQFIKIACQLKNGERLVRYAVEKRKLLSGMENREKRLSIFDIAADEAILNRNNDPVASAVDAQMAVETEKTDRKKTIRKDESLRKTE